VSIRDDMAVVLHDLADDVIGPTTAERLIVELIEAVLDDLRAQHIERHPQLDFADGIRSGLFTVRRALLGDPDASADDLTTEEP